MEYRIATSREDLWKVMVVRGIVFVEEQNVPWEGEVDQYEDEAVHLLGEEEGQPIVSGRFRFVDDGWCKLERVAVRKKWRGQGHGRTIMQRMLDEALKRGAKKLKLHAQVYLEDFYADFGFRREGAVFDECGIDHVLMIRKEA